MKRLNNVKYIFLLSYIGLLGIGCQSPSSPKISLIIDADTANEVDDLYAIVGALLEPKFDVLGLTAAQFHTSPLASDSTVLESQVINDKILKLMTKTAIPALIGSNEPLQRLETFRPSPASDFIVQQAHELAPNDTLHIVILGSGTNVATAILQDSTIVPKIAVHYLGFWHTPETNLYNKKEFNTGNDTLAIEFLLNTKALNFEVMSATTSQHLVFEKTNVDKHLKGKGGVKDYLVDRWEAYDRWWTKEDTLKEKWIMWDVAILEALATPEIATKTTFNTPPENTERTISIYTAIDVEKMKAQYWTKLDNWK